MGGGRAFLVGSAIACTGLGLLVWLADEDPELPSSSRALPGPTLTVDVADVATRLRAPEDAAPASAVTPAASASPDPPSAPPSDSEAASSLDQIIALGYAGDPNAAGSLSSEAEGGASEEALHALLLERRALGYVAGEAENRYWRAQDVAASQLHPAYSEGRLVGVSVAALPPHGENAFRSAGIQPGDMITHVNGLEVAQSDISYWALMEQLVQAERLEIEVVDAQGGTRYYEID